MFQCKKIITLTFILMLSLPFSYWQSWWPLSVLRKKKLYQKIKMPATLWVETLDILILIRMRLFAGMFQFTPMLPLIKNHVKNVCQDWTLLKTPWKLRYVIMEKFKFCLKNIISQCNLLLQVITNLFSYVPLGLWDCNWNQMWCSWLHRMYYRRGC